MIIMMNLTIMIMLEASSDIDVPNHNIDGDGDDDEDGDDNDDFVHCYGVDIISPNRQRNFGRIAMTWASLPAPRMFVQHLLQTKTKGSIKLYVSGPLIGESNGAPTVGFPSQRATNSVFISWRHHTVNDWERVNSHGATPSWEPLSRRVRLVPIRTTTFPIKPLPLIACNITFKTHLHAKH